MASDYKFCENQIQAEIDRLDIEIRDLERRIRNAGTIFGAFDGATLGDRPLMNSTLNNLRVLRNGNVDRLCRLNAYVANTTGIYNEPERLLGEANRLFVRIESAELCRATGNVYVPSMERVDEIIRERKTQLFNELVERVDDLITDDDLRLFKLLFEMNPERALKYLESYELMMLALSALPRNAQLVDGQYIAHFIEHVRNRVNAEAFILEFGAGRVFTEDEILYLGVILRVQRPENVNLNACIWEQYLDQVSPTIMGLQFGNIPDYLIPLHMFPTENSRDLFNESRKWAPLADMLMSMLP
ncbi:MAG: hypothetical protein FWD05_04415 [Oscillospiraceae bacterium]|nr:hypothetical protein [Oscillospiraceae bacterium]